LEKDKTKMTRRPAHILWALVAAVMLCLVFHVAVGTSQVLSASSVVSEILRGPYSLQGDNFIVWQFRLPRALECVLVGGLLGTVGSVFQALLRNPLADPYIVGVSSGAAVGGAFVLVLGVGESFGNLGIAAGGCVTGVLTLVLVYRLSLRRGVVDVRTLLLAGVVIGSLLSAVLSLMLLLNGKNEVDILHFLMGDISTANWPKTDLLAITLAPGFFLLYRESRKLNAFAIGEDTARRLGVDVRKLTKIVLLVGGIMTAVAVGTVGIIAFLGLVAPHIARKLVGVDWRWSMPASLGLGALLLLASDAVAQRFFSLVTHTPGMDIPVGIVTSVLGAPSLLVLLRKV
jgi:iron complex transport system permease protein